MPSEKDFPFVICHLSFVIVRPRIMRSLDLRLIAWTIVSELMNHRLVCDDK